MAAIDRLANTQFTPEEWQARVQLAACYRIFDLLGWTEAIYNHITLRLPGPDPHFLINPFGLHYREITASSLVKIDVEGNVIGDSEWGVNPAGFVPHSHIHRAVPDAHCVMHTHTTEGMAVACLEEGLSYTNFYAAQMYGHVAYHEFEGITLHGEEGPRMIQSLGDKRILILRNHGLMTMGPTVPHAFMRLWVLQRACEVQVAAQALGRPLKAIPEAVMRGCAEDAHRMNPKVEFGADVFEAFVRLVDARDPSYRN